MQPLQLPGYQFRIRGESSGQQIFDALRRRWVALTPEEWVRQNIIRYLTEELGYPASRIAVEHSLVYLKRKFRADAVLFSLTGKPLLLLECKAPEVKITQAVFDQIVRYNFEMQVDWLIVTNGLNHYCCKIDRTNLTYNFLQGIPDYASIE